MKPLSLRARNLRTWLELDLELPEGIAAIVGPNGAGKSTLVSVIDLALFGTGREMKRAKARGGADDTVEVELVFEHAGGRYRVRRSYQVKGAGKPRLDLLQRATVDEGGGLYRKTWQSLTRETIAETQADLEELLGLSRQTFRASSYLAQGDGAAFTQADPRDRKAILLDALGVRIWDRLKDAATERRRLAEGDLGRLLARLEAAEGRLAQRPAIAGALHLAEQEHGPIAAAVADIEAGLEERRRELEEAVVTAGEKVLLQAAVTAAAQRAAERKSAGALELAGLVRGIDEKSGELERLEALEHVEEQRLEEFGRIGDGLVDELAAAESDKAKVDAGEATCPTCKQALHGDALEAALEAVRARISALEERQGQHVAQAAQAATRRATVTQHIETGQAEVVERMRVASERGAELERELMQLERELEDARARLAEHDGPDIDRLRTDIAADEWALSTRRRDLAAAAERVTAARTRLDELDSLDASLDDDRFEFDLTKQEVATFKHAEVAYGRDGVPALILEAHAIPQLEAEANRIVAELGRGYRFELRTQRETQAGAVREALDIVVTTETGEALYEDFSGGERTRLDLSLRIALARLLAARRGADVRVLVIDEPAFLDADGFEQLAGVLRGLTPEFESVLVVSHEEALRDAFDSAIVVAGGGDSGEPSRLEEVHEWQTV